MRFSALSNVYAALPTLPRFLWSGGLYLLLAMSPSERQEAAPAHSSSYTHEGGRCWGDGKGLEAAGRGKNKAVSVSVCNSGDVSYLFMIWATSCVPFVQYRSVTQVCVTCPLSQRCTCCTEFLPRLVALSCLKGKIEASLSTSFSGIFLIGSEFDYRCDFIN